MCVQVRAAAIRELCSVHLPLSSCNRQQSGDPVNDVYQARPRDVRCRQTRRFEDSVGPDPTFIGSELCPPQWPVGRTVLPSPAVVRQKQDHGVVVYALKNVKLVMGPVSP